jgi:hypothetical protein
MTTTSTAATASGLAAPRNLGRRVGLGLHALVAAFLLLDAVLHVLEVEPVREAMATLGYAPGAAVLIGVVELACVALYLVPRTAVLGAVLLTGYLGGAVAAQLRIEAPLASTLLFPVYLGVAMWAGLWLRDARVRRLLEPRER